MQDNEVDIPVDASAATDRDSWLALIDLIGEEEGHFHTVGTRHWAMYVEDSPTLIVSFETVEQARARAGQMPLAHHVAAAKGWSHLCLIADGQTWYRDPAVYAYFDRLVDDAFFEDFDNILFYGAGPSAYAACAYSVAAPGSRVLALNPLATLDPAVAGWDDRFAADRKMDFTSRYGYAPDMVEGCASLALIFDPRQKADAMHAALFRAPFATALRARYAGGNVESVLSRLGILTDVVILAAEGRLTAVTFANLWRKRRDDAAYLKYLLQDVEQDGHRARALALCTNVVNRLKIHRFRKRLAEMTEATRPS
ncbi:MAG: hypothetical protein H7245_22760 [Candidatus Saccharibacteria bacterium]|nr:hypothetical protein [Pseudorhodobacter sp.]